MKKFAFVLAGLASVAAVTVPAAAAPPRPASNWVSINQRQANLDQRIDNGIRTGALTRTEGYWLRQQLRAVASTEASYRRTGGGLSYQERAELDRRFDTIAQRVRANKNDRQYVAYRR